MPYLLLRAPEGEMYFNHDKLECYAVALDVARWAARVKVPTGRRHLRDQLVRSADSVVLNSAEGAGPSSTSSARTRRGRLRSCGSPRWRRA